MKKQIVTDKKYLHMPCAPVPMDDNLIKSLFDDLLDTAKAASNPTAAGLAANQIRQQYTAFVMRYSGWFICIMNPEVLELSKKKRLSEERCLSHPGIGPVRVMRHREIKIRYYSPLGKEWIVRTFGGFESTVVQHEMDHGLGILI